MAIAGNVDTDPTASNAESDISRQLVAARLAATPLKAYPGAVPATLASAYAVQSMSIAAWPDTIVGWKVAKIAPSDQPQFGADRLAGPVFQSLLSRVDASSTVCVPIYKGGFAAVEAEFVVELGADVVPADKPYSDDELASLVAVIYAGAEVASSPMPMVNDLGPTSVVSDFGNNNGVVLGPAITDWRQRLHEAFSTRVYVDDVVVGETAAVTIAELPLQALRFLIGLAANRGFDLPAGTLVSTGATTGVHDVTLSSRARVDFGSSGWFDLTFEAMCANRYGGAI